MRKLIYFGNLVCSLLVLSACSKGPQTQQAMHTNLKELADKSATLAYQHYLSVETGQETMPMAMAQLQALCKAKEAAPCLLLESQLSSGKFATAQLKFRASPELARTLLDTASKLGTLIERSTSAEELQGPLQDAQKQTELLQDYRQRLEGLRDRAKNDVDALIKVHKELAQVQQDLESVQGRHQHLIQRVQTELVNIQLRSTEQRALSAPLREALADFAQNLAQGCATAITALAYLLPWMFVFAGFFLGLRKIWRWRKTKTRTT